MNSSRGAHALRVGTPQVKDGRRRIPARRDGVSCPMQIQVPETARANPLALAAAGCVALAAASLALPSEPTFGDPWIWIVWGRETVEGSLNTVTGSSWKPLPVILIAPTSLLGDDLVADAWLVIARAGFLGAIVLVHAIASRMAGRIAGLLSAGRPSLAAFPALEIVKRAVGMLNAPGALAAIDANALAAMSWARRGAAERVVCDDARRDAVALAVLGGAWTALVAVMTEAGYSGNERYLIVPMTLAYTLVGPGVAWTVKLAADRVPALRRAPAWAAAVLTLAAVAAYGARSVPGQLRTYDFEVATVQDLRTALARAGGPERLRACGVVDTHPMYRGLVAFELGLPMVEVGEEPEQRGAVLRTRFREGEAVVPAPLGGAETLRTGHWEVQLTCQRAVTDRHSTSDPG